jgi:hypothetical protein
MSRFCLQMFVIAFLTTSVAGRGLADEPIIQKPAQAEVVKPPEEKIPAHVLKALDEKIPLNFESVSIEDVLKFVHSATATAKFEGLEFALDILRPGKLGRPGPHLVTIHSENESLKVALGRLLDPLDLRLVVTDRFVLITAKAGGNTPKKRGGDRRR